VCAVDVEDAFSAKRERERKRAKNERVGIKGE
jgi:hypothetical protein